MIITAILVRDSSLLFITTQPYSFSFLHVPSSPSFFHLLILLLFHNNNAKFSFRRRVLSEKKKIDGFMWVYNFIIHNLLYEWVLIKKKYVILFVVILALFVFIIFHNIYF